MGRLKVTRFPHNCGIIILSDFQRVTRKLRKKVYDANVEVNSKDAYEQIFDELSYQTDAYNYAHMAITGPSMPFEAETEKALRKLGFKQRRFYNGNSENHNLLWFRESRLT